MKYLLRNLSLVLVVFLWSCTSGDDIVDYSNLAPENTASGPTIGYNEDRNVYFGDLHVHTKHSFDAYIFGTTATPDDAYEYAKERFIEDNEELVEEIGEDKVNYHDLYELGMGEKAEELSEMEMDMGDDSIMMSS